jgi:membrane protease YdiL (CAAX protease family)
VAVPLLEEFWDNLLAYAITAGVAGAAVVPLFFLAKGRRLLPMQRLRRGNWTGREVCFAFFLLLFVPGLASDLLDGLGLYQVIFDKPPSTFRMAVWASPLATLLTLASIFWLLFQFTRTRPSHLGMTRARWPQNVFLGYLSFLVLTPVVLGCYLLVLLLLGGVHETHELETLFKEITSAPAPRPSFALVEWILLVCLPVVAAPVLEETVFRGVLQGWLRRASLVGHVPVMGITLAIGLQAYLKSIFGDPTQLTTEANIGPLIFAVIMTLGYGCAIYLVWGPVIREGDRYFSPLRTELDATSMARNKDAGFAEVILPSQPPESPLNHDLARRRLRDWEEKNAILAIFGSAMLFAVFHSSVWPSPIPLLLMGIGLGFLAYRTQSLLPGMIMHSLFNTVACVELALAAIKN